MDEAAQRYETDVICKIRSIDDTRVAVDNANWFVVGQLLDVHSSGFGFTYRGTVIVTWVEIWPKNEICVHGDCLPSVGKGDLLVRYLGIKRS